MSPSPVALTLRRGVRPPAWRQACALLVGLALPGPLPVLGAAERAEPASPRRPASRALAPRQPFPKSAALARPAGSDPARLVVKLVERSSRETYERLLPGRAPEALPAVLSSLRARRPEIDIAPLFEQPKLLLDILRLRGEQRSGERLADLSTFYRVVLPETKDAERVLDELLASHEVETVHATVKTRGPVDLPPTTAYFGANQGYRQPGPAGLDFDRASLPSLNLTGAGVTIADVEQNWNLSHEDLDHLGGASSPVPLVPLCDWADPDCDNPNGRCPLRPAACTNPADLDHGMAVLGVINGGRNGYGIDGFAPNAALRVVPTSRLSQPTWTGVNAVMAAVLALQPGDVILLEAQVQVGAAAFVPFETFPAEFAVVRQATALGIHVIEPAANTQHGMNLDTNPAVLDPNAAAGQVRSLFDRYVRDSGAVLVGGGRAAVVPGQPSGSYHERYCNSNFGSAVDTYAWGENVATAGYRNRLGGAACNLFPASPGFDQDYTACFNGTSSAGAQIAALTALLEEFHERRFARPFGPRELRNHLSLGTASTPPAPGTPCFAMAGTVGHQPDLGHALELLSSGGVVAHLFEAQSGAATGSSQSEFGQSVAVAGDLDQDGTPDIAVGAPKTDVPAPGGGLRLEAGRVHFFSGRTGRELARLDGEQDFEHFGAAIVNVGNFNGLPWEEIAIAAPDFDVPGGALDAGSVRIFWASIQASGGPALVQFSRFDNNVADERFGAALAFGGNGRLIVGAPADHAPGLTGRALVVDPTFTPLFQRVGLAGAQFGFAVANARDLDGDLVDDWLVGAPEEPGPSSFDRGALYGFSGASGAPLLRVAGRRVTPLSTPGLRYGAAVAGIGDFDGDGRNDIAVGAPGSPHSGPSATNGRVDILDAAGNTLGFVAGTHPRSHFGRSLARLGDFDGDGFADVAVGAPTNTAAFFLATNGGEVFVLRGRQRDPDGTIGAIKSRRFATLEPRTQWGAAVAGGADINGDGLPDVLAGEPLTHDGGRAFVFAAQPAPDPTPGFARLISDPGVIEAKDVSTNGLPSGCDGFSGGGTSPGTTRFTLDAGPSFAGALFVITGLDASGNILDWGPFITGNVGLLDANGRTPAPALLGPLPAAVMCPAFVGTSFRFLAGALRDSDGDGSLDDLRLSNESSLQVMTEFTNCACP